MQSDPLEQRYAAQFGAISPVSVPGKNTAELSRVTGELKAHALAESADQLRSRLGRKTFWHVNSTATGGGVAEMLRPLLGYANSLGIDARWLVVHGNGPFFQLTKRIHNALHGSEVTHFIEADAQTYESALADAAIELGALVEPGEPVVLHDPQTAGLAPTIRTKGGVVIWRCHVGSDTQNEHTEAAWRFLRRYLEDSVDVFVFTREAYAPDWIDRSKLTVIPPSIDPVSPKNRYRDEDEIDALLMGSGLLQDGRLTSQPVFTREDGSLTPVTAQVDLNGTQQVPNDVPVMTQVSRWDRLKDMSGVLRAFAEGGLYEEAHLALVGPQVSGVSDDPEGAGVLATCIEQYNKLPETVKRRVTLASVPMDDPEQNAAIINALQRRATLVAQKSLAEGFGLTVTEAMFKRRTVVASKIGGIPDQLTDGVEGRLLPNPSDLGSFAEITKSLLADTAQQGTFGASAERRAITEFLMDRHLRQYFDLLMRCMA